MNIHGKMRVMVVASTMVALFLHHFAIPEQRILPSTQSVQSQGVLTVQVKDGGIITSIPRGSQRIPMLKLSLRASCSADISVDEVNVKRVGLGDRSDISAVYAMSGTRRLSRANSVPRKSGEVQLRLRRFLVPACEQREVSILMDLSPEAAIAGEHRFVLGFPDPVDAGLARVIVQKSSLPVMRRTAALEAGTIEFGYRNTNINARYGQHKELSTFRLIASDENHHLISAIRFKNNGTAKSEHLQNLYIETGRRERVTKILRKMDGDTAYLEFDPPLILRRYREREFTLRGDIIGSTYRNIQFVIEEPSDIEARVIRRRSM